MFTTLFKGKEVINISMNGSTLSKVPTYKYLGVILDPFLKYDKFVDTDIGWS